MLKYRIFTSRFLTFFLLVIFLFSLLTFFTISTASASSGYTTNNGVIYKDGSPIALHGVSWFGAETDAHVPHGLWTRNWKDMISQIKSVGFNAVRIPFCPSTFRGTNTQSIEYSKNPDLVGLNSQQVMDKILLELNNQQIHMLLDFHRIDCYEQSSLWYTPNYSEETWINDLQFISNRYKNLGYFMGVDLKNEPKAPATWGTGNRWTDWNTAAEKAGSAVLNANSNILVYVEGITDNPSCTNTNFGMFWGENLQAQNCYPISVSSIPQDKLIFSPHVYGPDVFMQGYFTAGNFPQNMPEIWDQHFGFLADKGYTLVPGEWGGKYGNGGDQRDVTWQNAIVNYFKSKKICNSFYWSWNPNSGDTGGVLTDDWTTVWSNKMDMLRNYFSSCSPTPLANYQPTSTPAPTSIAPTLTVAPTTTVTVTPKVTQVPVQNQYTVAGSAKCLLKFSIRNKWDNGYTADITITNKSGEKINDWKLLWTLANGEKVDYLWSGKDWVNNNQLNVLNEFWNGAIENNGSTMFGFNGSYSGDIKLPTDATLNGMDCEETF